MTYHPIIEEDYVPPPPAASETVLEPTTIQYPLVGDGVVIELIHTSQLLDPNNNPYSDEYSGWFLIDNRYFTSADTDLITVTTTFGTTYEVYPISDPNIILNGIRGYVGSEPYIVIFKNVGRGKAGYTNPMSIECDTGHLRTEVLKASYSDGIHEISYENNESLQSKSESEKILIEIRDGEEYYYYSDIKWVSDLKPAVLRVKDNYPDTNAKSTVTAANSDYYTQESSVGYLDPSIEIGILPHIALSGIESLNRSQSEQGKAVFKGVFNSPLDYDQKRIFNSPTVDSDEGLRTFSFDTKLSYKKGISLMYSNNVVADNPNFSFTAEPGQKEYRVSMINVHGSPYDGYYVFEWVNGRGKIVKVWRNASQVWNRYELRNEIVEYSLEPSISDMDELSSFMSSANRPLGEPVGYLTKPRDGEEVNLPIYELNFAEVYVARKKIMLGDLDLLTLVENIGFNISGDNVPSQSRLLTKNGIQYKVCDYVFHHSHTAVYTMEIFDTSTNEFITHTGKITVDFPDEVNEAPQQVSVAEKSTDGSYALNIVEYTPSVAASQRILTSSNRSAAEVPPTKNIIGSPSSEFEGVDGTDLLNFLNEYNESESTIGDEPTVVDRDLENCIPGEVIVSFQNEDEWELILDRIRDLGQGYELLEKFTANAFLVSFDPNSKTLIQALDELETVEGVSYAECNRMITIAGENPPADETNDDAPEENQEASSLPPTTTLSGPVLAGATLLPVNDTTGFTSGDSVVIDKGTNIEETGQIASISSIVLTEPLQYNHAAGASIEKIETVDCSAIPESCRVTIPELTHATTSEDTDEFIVSRGGESFKVSMNEMIQNIITDQRLLDKVTEITAGAQPSSGGSDESGGGVAAKCSFDGAYNGSGNIPVSGATNIASVTRDNTGIYTVNFTSPITEPVAFVSAVNPSTANPMDASIVAITSTSVQIITGTNTSGGANLGVHLLVF